MRLYCITQNPVSKMPEYLKIGYVPYSPDLSHPDDRRRFPYFAERNKIEFEIADTRKAYDIILLPAPANLTKWKIYRQQHPDTKFIFEMVDSLIYQSDWFNIMFKGIGRFVTRKESRPCFIHRDLLIDWIKMADYVICSNPIVHSEISKWNNHVFVSLDYLEHEYHFIKSDYSINGKMKLFWEGQSVVLPQLLAFKEVFKEVSSFCELHIVSTESFPRFGQFWNRSTQSLLNQLPIDTYFHAWSLEKNIELFSQFDCGIIPLNKNDKYGWHKPANKLISFWFSGLPTLASDTPAYHRVGEMSDKGFICSTANEWIQKIRWVKELSPNERENMAQAQFKDAKRLFSNEIHDRFWFNLLKSTAQSFAKNVATSQDVFRMAV